ncbi:MAG: SAM-dependent methyltransferase [Ktedonobacteraceae bacterium]
MDRNKYTTIAHQGMRYCNPFSSEKIEDIINLLDLTLEARVLDIGAGKAELLIRLVERFSVHALGIDFSSAFLSEAYAQAKARIPPEKLTLQECDVTTFQAGVESFDLVICLGASHILGGFQGTLQHMDQWVRPGGQILIGDGYWKQEPAPEYLAAMGATRDEYLTHAQNVAIGVAKGLIPMYASVCNDDEWGRYEWLHLRNIERYAMQHPDDPDVPALIARIRSWRDLYLRWGRETLGFGLYLFQKSVP